MDLKHNQPDYAYLKELGLHEDYLFQVLAYMGNASHQMAWASTTLSAVDEVPVEVITGLKEIYQKMCDVQEQLRDIRKGTSE